VLKCSKVLLYGVTMKLLFDFLPIFLFFITYKFFGIYAATGVAMAGSLLQVAYHRIKYKQFESMHLVTFFSILILGGATLLMHNEIFIKWKPTILYWLLGLIFTGTSLFGKKPLLQRMMETNIKLPAVIWKKLNIGWSLFFLLLGCANLYVVYHFTTNTWVNFKLFGTLGLTLLFVVVQSFYMAKFVEVESEEK
jgi:intracellular septation protein